MKRKFINKKIIVILSLILAVLPVPFIIFISRAPVLIVIEEDFINYYGKDRIKREVSYTSALLFRAVKNVITANDAGDDIISLAVSEVSRDPYCVLFPLRFVKAAKMYKEQNPQVNTVILEGRYPEDKNPSLSVIRDTPDYFIYKTEIIGDVYKAGYTAAAIHYFYEPKTEEILENDQKKEIVFFSETDIPQVKETFNKAIADFEELNRKQMEEIRKQREKAIEKKKKVLEKEQKTLQKALEKEQKVQQKALEKEQKAQQKALEKEQKAQKKALEREQRAELRAQRRAGKEQIVSDKDQIETDQGTETANVQEPPTKFPAEPPTKFPEVDVKTPETGKTAKEPAASEDKVSALQETKPEEEQILLPNVLFFNSISQLTDKSKLSCVVIVDIGHEYFEKNAGIPIIHFTWLNPYFLPDDVVVVVNDSLWVQALQAVKMAGKGIEKGFIQSKFLFSNAEKFDKSTLRKIRKTW